MIDYKEQIAKEQLFDDITFVEVMARNVIQGDVSCLAAMFKVATELDDVFLADEISNVDYAFDQLMILLDDVVSRCEDVREGEMFAGFEYGKLG